MKILKECVNGLYAIILKIDYKLSYRLNGVLNATFLCEAGHKSWEMQSEYIRKEVMYSEVQL